MKADIFIKILRKVIREEVQLVVREELGLLLETPESKPVVENKKSTMKNSMVESIKPTRPTQPSKPMSFTNNNILNDILNETKQTSEWQALGNMDSSMAQNFSGNAMMNEVQVVNSVDQMLANTRPAGDINAVKIDVVPDFTALMSKMKKEGQI